MKIIRILLAIISFMVCTGASAEIDVDVLTRGGWETQDGDGINFFNADGTATSCGYTIVPFNWYIATDGLLKLTYEDDINEYVTEIKDGVMYWRNGMKSFHRPFAEKSNEESRRVKRNYRDNGWVTPRSANALSEQLYGNSYISESLDKAIYFSSPDTCIISDFVLNDINRKYHWQAIDSANVRLDVPNKSRTVKILMHPDAFNIIEGDFTGKFVLNVTNESDALGVTYDMCLMPLGCSGFFTDSSDDVMAHLRNAFPLSGDNPPYSVFIGGRKWDCNGAKVTSTERGVSYIYYPTEDDSADLSYVSMSSVLGNMFQEVRSPLGEHTKMYVSPYYGSLDTDADDVVITLIKLAPGENIKNGSVILDVRKK